MVIDETLIELFDTDIEEDILLDSWNCFEMKKKYIFSTSTHILESVFVAGDTFQVWRR